MLSRPKKNACLALLCAFSSTAFSTAIAAERPPQYVALAFDNCTENTRWQELGDFSREMNRDGRALGFTYFVSGVNLLPNDQRMTYQGPGQAVGRSNIGFGGTRETVEKRVRLMRELFDEGQELASHAVGHFDGSTWTAADWKAEQTFFHRLVAKWLGRDVLQALVGFRAPYLAHSPGLFETLKGFHYRYDTSGTGGASDWPRKIDGLWRFNLASLVIAGSGKKTLSMDYNFLVADSGGKDDPNPANRDRYRAQMLATYEQYFLKNYTGNRAPLHIGHHFTLYQGGAYNEALKQFARKVCGLPEVKCVTYRELADFMDATPDTVAREYQAGNFRKAAPPF